MNKKIAQIQAIKQLIELTHNNPEIEVLWLYGSQARNNANENSGYQLKTGQIFM